MCVFSLKCLGSRVYYRQFGVILSVVLTYVCWQLFSRHVRAVLNGFDDLSKYYSDLIKKSSFVRNKKVIYFYICYKKMGMTRRSSQNFINGTGCSPLFRNRVIPKRRSQASAGNYYCFNQTFKKRSITHRPLRIKGLSQDFTKVLNVETSVEYDLPAHIYPPPGAEPILIIDHNSIAKNKLRIRKNNSQSTSNASNKSFLGCSTNSLNIAHRADKSLISYRNSKSYRKSKEPVPLIDLASQSPEENVSISVNDITKDNHHSRNVSHVSINKSIENSNEDVRRSASYVVDDVIIQKTNQLALQIQKQKSRMVTLPPPSYTTATRSQFSSLPYTSTSINNSSSINSDIPAYSNIPIAHNNNQSQYSMPFVSSQNQYTNRIEEKPATSLNSNDITAAWIQDNREHFAVDSRIHQSNKSTSPVHVFNHVPAPVYVTHRTPEQLSLPTIIDSNTTPMIGAGAPTEIVPPHAISTAHIGRARCSPKVRSRRHVATSVNAAPNYHKGRPRANTVGHTSLQASSVNSNCIVSDRVINPNNLSVNVDNTSVNTDMVMDLSSKRSYRNSYNNVGPNKMVQQGPMGPVVPNVVSDYARAFNPCIADTPQMYSAQLTPSESMDIGMLFLNEKLHAYILQINCCLVIFFVFLLAVNSIQCTYSYPDKINRTIIIYFNGNMFAFESS